MKPIHITQIKTSKGRVSNQGNGRVGGTYGSSVYEGYAQKNIFDLCEEMGLVELSDNIADKIFSTADKILDLYYEATGEENIIVRAKMSSCFDESTNHESTDIEEVYEPTDVRETIKSMDIDPDVREKVLEGFESWLDSLNAADFEPCDYED